MSNLNKFVIMFVFVFLDVLPSPCKGFDSNELNLLLSLKSSMIDPSRSLSSWKKNSSSHCSWNGITCLPGSSHVSKIKLPGKNLSGQIPDSVFTFPFLQSINLSNNLLSGQIPKNLSLCPSLQSLDLSNNFLSGPIPENIGLFSGLKYLDLGGNGLTGRIPPSIKNLTGLEHFTLASNGLTGELPGRELGLMRSLKWVYFGYNNFSGRVPARIADLTLLAHLDLVYNNLSGEIPPSLGNLKSLENLFLYFNRLTGKIPPSIFRLTNLRSLDLSDNSLTGQIPDDVAGLTRLEVLHLFSNRLSGRIPPALSSLPRLRVLQLWSNELSGSIPTELGLTGNLTVLDLSTNNLTGKIPGSLCESGGLKKLILFSNSLSGEIPVGLGRCKSLERVRIEGNELTGRVPAEFTKMPLVYYLDLSSNRLSGRVDDREWEMPRLRMMSLARNGLFGPIPGSFGSGRIEKLDLSRNRFSGKIPEGLIEEFSEIVELKLSENELSGRIPNLSRCKKLVSLDLSRNHLTGEIPVSISGLPVLGQLDLSDNELTGKVPWNLGQVESLVEVNISYNHFQGKLPMTGAFLAINSTSVAGNNLCGGKKTTGLPPCGSSNIRARWLALIFLLAAIVIFSILVSIAIFLRRGKSLKMKFLNSRFVKKSTVTVEEIVSSIKEENLVSTKKSGFSYKGKSGKLSFFAKEIDSATQTEWIKSCGVVNHPNVVRMLKVCRSEKAAIIVHEFIEGKDLSEVIGGLGWARRIKVAVGVSRALEYLHFSCSPCVVVGEVSPRKIIVDEKGEPHLRLSLRDGANVRSDTKGFDSSTYGYAAPEIILGSNKESMITEKSDVYGFGLLLIELLTGKSRFDPELGIHESLVEWARHCYSDCHLETWVDDVIVKNEKGVLKLDEYRQNQIVETMNLALRCTAGDPAARPCAVDLVERLESVRARSYCAFFVV